MNGFLRNLVFKVFINNEQHLLETKSNNYLLVFNKKMLKSLQIIQLNKNKKDEYEIKTKYFIFKEIK